VDQRDRHRAVSALALRSERSASRGEVEWLDQDSIRADAPAHLEHRAGHRRGLPDRELEQLRPLLGADREQIAEARIGDEQSRHTAPLEQRVGGDRGAQLDAHARGVGRAGRVEDLPDQLRGRFV
jgi:hypothetical protein